MHKAVKKTSKLTTKLPVAQVTIMEQPKVSSPDKYAESDRKWKAEDALRDIERAKKHMQDKQLMSDVKKMAAAKIKALKDIC